MNESLKTKILTSIGAAALVGGAILGCGAAVGPAPVSDPNASVYQLVNPGKCVIAMNGYTRVCNYLKLPAWLRIG